MSQATSATGTKRTNRAGLEMSVDGGKIGSGWPTVKPTRMTRCGLVPMSGVRLCNAETTGLELRIESTIRFAGSAVQINP
jgi:hypothetical protein